MPLFKKRASFYVVITIQTKIYGRITIIITVLYKKIFRVSKKEEN